MKILYTLAILLLCSSVLSQNLILNPSFEEYDDCPSSTSQIDQAISWSNSLETSDYYHGCADQFTNVSVPGHVTGWQEPFDGQAYNGVLTYGSFSSNYSEDLREYFTGTLTEPLEIGTEYFISFKVSLSNLSSYASNNLGVLFRMDDLPLSGIPNEAHMFTTEVVTDTSEWVVIEGSFIADNNYAYATFGNLFDDAQTVTEEIQPIVLGWQAYYHFDDFCISISEDACETIDVEEIYRLSNNIIAYPNPVTDQLTIASGTFDLLRYELFDLSGNIVDEGNFSSQTNIDMKSLSQGMYFYKILKNNTEVKIGKVIKD